MQGTGVPPQQRHTKWLMILALVWTAALQSALAETPTLAGIIEGSATFIRQTVRYALEEGVVLRAEDIVETGPKSFVQIEHADGTLIGLGEATRIVLEPKLARGKPPKTPRLYVLEGWLKVAPPAGKTLDFDYLTPRLELITKAATTVGFISNDNSVVFVESGSARLVERDGATSQLSGGEYATRAAGEKTSIARRVPGDFLQRLPRHFRDRLPARAAVLAKRSIEPKPLGDVSYEEVTPWLRTEAPLRLTLSRQWRARAQDKNFRAGVVANLAQHMEWERVVFPERFIVKKKPPDPPLPVPVATPASAPAGPQRN